MQREEKVWIACLLFLYKNKAPTKLNTFFYLIVKNIIGLIYVLIKIKLFFR